MTTIANSTSKEIFSAEILCLNVDTRGRMWFHAHMVSGGRVLRFHGPAIRAWREQRGFTNGGEFAALLGMTGGWLSNIEKDRREPSRDAAFALARRLGITDMRVILRDYPDVPLPVDRPEVWPEDWQ